LLLGGSLTLTSYAVSAGQGLVKTMPGSLSVLLTSIELIVLAAGVAALFRYVPNTHVRWRHALFGGVFVALAFTAAKSGLAWYVKQVPTYSTLYGAFATVPIFLIWLYLGWVIMLVGAVLAAHAPSLSQGLHRHADAPGQRFEMALNVLRELWRSQQAGEGGMSSLALTQRLRIDPLQLEPVLDELLELDWLGRLEEGGAQRLVLLCSPEQVPAEPLLKAMLAQRSEGLAPLWQRSDWERLKLAELLA
jgi:membrane protein